MSLLDLINRQDAIVLTETCEGCDGVGMLPSPAWAEFTRDFGLGAADKCRAAAAKANVGRRLGASDIWKAVGREMAVAYCELPENQYVACPVCDGTGRVPTTEAKGLAAVYALLIEAYEAVNPEKPDEVQADWRNPTGGVMGR
jgi:hypothetical protein